MIFFWSLKNEATRGYGGFGALGHSVYHRELIPRLVEGSWRGEITHIATSGVHTAAITESGCLSAHCIDATLDSNMNFYWEVRFSNSQKALILLQ